MGGLLAILILWLFLKNLRLVFFIALSIPISVYTAFNFFYAFGITINSLTLVGMALAIGMLLDNSVVVIEALKKYWNRIGLKTKVITWKSDFRIDSREYNLAKSITDLYTSEEEDILIVEYPNLREASISLELLQEANLNILVARADRGWKETDKLLSEKLSQQVGKTPLYVYLTHASRNVVEDYTGMLPPYTLWRKIVYRLSQLALTESIFTFTKRKKQPATSGDEDDE